MSISINPIQTWQLPPYGWSTLPKEGSPNIPSFDQSRLYQAAMIQTRFDDMVKFTTPPQNNLSGFGGFNVGMPSMGMGMPFSTPFMNFPTMPGMGMGFGMATNPTFRAPYAGMTGMGQPFGNLTGKTQKEMQEDMKLQQEEQMNDNYTSAIENEDAIIEEINADVEEGRGVNANIVECNNDIRQLTAALAALEANKPADDAKNEAKEKYESAKETLEEKLAEEKRELKRYKSELATINRRIRSNKRKLTFAQKQTSQITKQARRSGIKIERVPSSERTKMETLSSVPTSTGDVDVEHIINKGGIQPTPVTPQTQVPSEQVQAGAQSAQVHPVGQQTKVPEVEPMELPKGVTINKDDKGKITIKLENGKTYNIAEDDIQKFVDQLPQEAGKVTTDSLKYTIKGTLTQEHISNRLKEAKTLGDVFNVFGVEIKTDNAGVTYFEKDGKVVPDTDIRLTTIKSLMEIKADEEIKAETELDLDKRARCTNIANMNIDRLGAVTKDTTLKDFLYKAYGIEMKANPRGRIQYTKGKDTVSEVYIDQILTLAGFVPSKDKIKLNTTLGDKAMSISSISQLMTPETKEIEVSSFHLAKQLQSQKEYKGKADKFVGMFKEIKDELTLTYGEGENKEELRTFKHSSIISQNLNSPSTNLVLYDKNNKYYTLPMFMRNLINKCNDKEEFIIINDQVYSKEALKTLQEQISAYTSDIVIGIASNSEFCGNDDGTFKAHVQKRIRSYKDAQIAVYRDIKKPDYANIAKIVKALYDNGNGEQNVEFVTWMLNGKAEITTGYCRDNKTKLHHGELIWSEEEIANNFANILYRLQLDDTNPKKLSIKDENGNYIELDGFDDRQIIAHRDKIMEELSKLRKLKSSSSPSSASSEGSSTSSGSSATMGGGLASGQPQPTYMYHGAKVILPSSYGS